MPAKPPPIPEVALQRVLTTAKVDGYVVLLCSGVGALFLAYAGWHVTAVVICLIAGAGAMEIHGTQLLEREDLDGVNWLVRAQLLILLITLAWITFCMLRLSLENVRPFLPQFREFMGALYKGSRLKNPYDAIDDSQLTVVLRVMSFVFLSMLGVTTCVYQGLMARYYHKSRGPIERALESSFDGQ